MKFNIDIPDEYIEEMINKKLEASGMAKGASKKEEPINGAGPHFKTILEAAKRLGKGDGKPTGIRFKIGNEMVETSVGTTAKDQATKILEQHGISVARFCAAALEVCIAEHQTLKKKKGA